MKTIMTVFVMSVMLMASTSWALDVNVGPYFDGFKDVTGYTRNLSSNEVPRAATGLCGSTLARVSHNGQWLADLLSPCAFGATTLTGESNPTAILGAEAINFLGMRVGLGYNTNDSKWSVFFGISLTGAAGQLTKAATP